MARVALYVGAVGYLLIAAGLGILYSLEVDVFIGAARYQPINILAGAILMALIAAFLWVAGRDIPRSG